MASETGTFVEPATTSLDLLSVDQIGMAPRTEFNSMAHQATTMPPSNTPVKLGQEVIKEQEAKVEMTDQHESQPTFLQTFAVTKSELANKLIIEQESSLAMQSEKQASEASLELCVQKTESSSTSKTELQTPSPQVSAVSAHPESKCVEN